MGEGQLRIFHHVERGKVDDYCQGEIKNSLTSFQDERTRGNRSI